MNIFFQDLLLFKWGVPVSVYIVLHDNIIYITYQMLSLVRLHL